MFQDYLYFGEERDAMDKKYMLRAIELAKKATGFTCPNPLVGAVIVKDGRIIGEGWHHRYGELHAERDALKNCTESASGASIYVTLEPCCHYGKQPPCVEAIIEAGIKKVIVGSRDPNPLVSGKGNAYLREHGIEVTEDYMRDECDAMNYVFFHYITTGTPYVVMKYAMTLDGKIASHTGDSKWITGEQARHRVHLDRHRYTGIMAGSGTVLADDPELTCRIDGLTDPVRIICDSRLRTPVDSKIVRTAHNVRTIIATAQTSGHERYTDCGCEIIQVPEKNGHIDLNELMSKLGELKIDSIMLEGGGTLNWSALEAGIVNRIQCYIAPKIIGGNNAPSPIRGTGLNIMNDAVKLTAPDIIKLGDDYMIEGEIQHVYRNN